MSQNTTQETVTKYFDVAAEEFDSIYTGEGKGFWGRLLDRSLRKDMYERFRLTVENCGDIPDRTVLDVGCGTGRFSIALAQRNARVVGIDPAPTMLAIANRLAHAATDTEELKLRSEPLPMAVVTDPRWAWWREMAEQIANEGSVV